MDDIWQDKEKAFLFCSMFSFEGMPFHRVLYSLMRFFIWDWRTLFPLRPFLPSMIFRLVRTWPVLIVFLRFWASWRRSLRIIAFFDFRKSAFKFALIESNSPLSLSLCPGVFFCNSYCRAIFAIWTRNTRLISMPFEDTIIKPRMANVRIKFRIFMFFYFKKTRRLVMKWMFKPTVHFL